MSADRAYLDELNASLARHYEGDPAPVDGLRATFVPVEGGSHVILDDPEPGVPGWIAGEFCEVRP